MTDHLPAPLTPPECDLRDFQFMPLDISRLFGSEFHSHATDSEWRAGVTLWLKSYHQVPAASMPDDDISLARAAEFGVQVKAWRKVRDKALRGWVKCSDDRLYHPVVAEKALEGWIEKLNARKSSGAGNAKRYGQTFDPAPIDQAIQAATGMLAALNPNSRKLRIRNATGMPPGDKKPPTGSPDHLPPGSQETGKGQGQLRDNEKDTCAAASRAAPVDASPEFIRIPTNRFETAGEEVAFTEKFIEDFQGLYPAVDVRAELRAARAWCVSNPPLRKTKKGMTRFINSWLSRQQNKGVPRETGYRNGQAGKRSAHDNFNAGVGLYLESLGENDERGRQEAHGPDADATRLPLLAP